MMVQSHEKFIIALIKHILWVGKVDKQASLFSAPLHSLSLSLTCLSLISHLAYSHVPALSFSPSKSALAQLLSPARSALDSYSLQPGLLSTATLSSPVCSRQLLSPARSALAQLLSLEKSAFAHVL